ncbi:hypothetical protein AGMMS50262_15080 [Bacteroidia bacterium]|nr:hypothetical protein AGMMS50262_15080 [Bacteroidia bacterium]
MSKIGIIIKREYGVRVRKKSFLVITLLMPLLFAGLVFMAQHKVDLSGFGELATDTTTVGILFTFLIYTFIMAYGAMVLQGVMEEKTNRIIEIMVSSVKPFDLMMGKIMGIGLVGLTQYALWGILLIAGSWIVTGSPLSFSGSLMTLSLYFILFFIGGYLIYASIFAAIGAIVNSHEDTQQYMMPITLLILFAFYAGFFGAQNPDGALAFWTSIIPLTSPIVMMTRLAYGVPFWQLLVSTVLLSVTVWLFVRLAAKIYRTGILMYGKKPAFSEIMKWLKY